MFKSFSEMPVWIKAHNLSVEIFKMTINLPISEDYGLSSQIRKSANSVSGNIAEGFGRSTNKDKANFYIIDRGSVFETQNHLIYGNKIGYFNDDKVDQIINEYNQIVFEINKIMLRLRQPQPQP